MATKPKGGQLTISLSAIIASVWAGIWGFYWAASRLDGTELFVAILIGLFVGTVLTAYLVERTFHTVDTSGAGDNTVTIKGQNHARAKALNRNPHRESKPDGVNQN